MHADGYNRPVRGQTGFNWGGRNYCYRLAPGEYPYPGLMGSYDYRIRADMVYFTTPDNDAVFSTGSIAFSQSLPYNNFDNNISKLLGNILTTFSRNARLPGLELDVGGETVALSGSCPA